MKVGDEVRVKPHERDFVPAGLRHGLYRKVGEITSKIGNAFFVVFPEIRRTAYFWEGELEIERESASDAETTDTD